MEPRATPRAVGWGVLEGVGLHRKCAQIGERIGSPQFAAGLVGVLLALVAARQVSFAVVGHFAPAVAQQWH